MLMLLLLRPYLGVQVPIVEKATRIMPQQHVDRDGVRLRVDPADILGCWVLCLDLAIALERADERADHSLGGTEDGGRRLGRTRAGRLVRV
jgi:hypothetical protein